MGFLSSLFGVGDRTPKRETVVQAQKIPEELAPFVKQILGEAQELYKGEIERGYDPYTGEMIAPLTPEEETAMSGISGLAGTTKPFLEEALQTYRTGGEKFTPEVAQEYMSPYQRAVTDIEKREAQTAFERKAIPQFEKRAVDAGGMSGLGTRAGVEAAEMQRGQSQLLADIEAKGLQSAFQNAQVQFAQQKAREQQMAGQIGRTGPALFQAGLAEQGALQSVGEQKRDLAQSGLDEAYAKFMQEKAFPQQTLADYSGTVYGNPYARGADLTQTTTGMPGAPSTAQQMLGLGLTGLNIYGAGTVGGGPWSAGTMAKTMMGMKASGGRLSGLSNLPVIRRQGGSGEVVDTIDEQETIIADPEIQARLDAQRAAQNALVVDIPKPKDYVSGSTVGEAKNLYQHLDPEKVRAMREKSIGEIQDIFSSSEGREKKLLDAYLKRKKELLGEEGYPFANIQSAISAAMDEPTIAMGIIKGAEKAGQLTKADKKEVKKAELVMLGEEFGLEKEQLAKKEKRALNIFERNSSLRKRLLSLPSELRDKVMQQISNLKGIQIKDAQIAKLLADAEAALHKGATGVAAGLSLQNVQALLSTIYHPAGSARAGQPIVPAAGKSNSAGTGAATALARNIMMSASDQYNNTSAGQKRGTIENAQMRALQDNAQAISNAYHSAMKTSPNPLNPKGSVTQQQAVPNILQQHKNKILQQPGTQTPSVSVP